LRHASDMPNINPRVLADWIQIAASVSVIAAIVFLVVDLAYTRQPIGSEQTNQVFNAASETGGASFGEKPGEVTKERQAELRYFVEKNCPACHGLQFRSSIGPELSKAGLQHLSVNAVTFTILYGYQVKGMPAWGTQLSKNDAYWIAEFLKRGGIQ